MQNNSIDLLPEERRRVLAIEYYLRLGTTAALSLALLAIVYALLLLPTHVRLMASRTENEIRLANLEARHSSSDETERSARLEALSKDVETLAALADVPSVSAAMRAALAVPRPGILLTNFSYASTAGGRSGTLSISGLSATRDALRDYQIALGAASFARSADLPISAFAKSSDITFTITVTLTP